MVPQVELFFVRFLGELKTPKYISKITDLQQCTKKTSTVWFVALNSKTEKSLQNRRGFHAIWDFFCKNNLDQVVQNFENYFFTVRLSIVYVSHCKKKQVVVQYFKGDQSDQHWHGNELIASAAILAHQPCSASSSRGSGAPTRQMKPGPTWATSQRAFRRRIKGKCNVSSTWGLSLILHFPHGVARDPMWEI